jgi:hypothetical protein
LRVALVLDNTMASAGKMPAPQTAAKNMLAKLKSAATTNGDIYVSIIPIVKDGNHEPGGVYRLKRETLPFTIKLWSKNP